jgi:hypothetical protein
MRIQFRSLVLGGIVLCAVATARIASAVFPEFGRGVCNSSGAQQHSVITTDGAGGAIVAWEDFRIQPSVIAVNHVLATGQIDPVWLHNGRAVLRFPLENPDGGQNFPIIVSDGAGGAIVAWQDSRSAVTEIDLFAQHVLANGRIDEAWPPTGVPVSAALGLQSVPTMTSDGAGGAIVTWMDNRPGSIGFDIFAQHVLATGVVDPLWPANGFPICTAADGQQFPVITGDGSGGAIIAWFDERVAPNELDIFAQRILNTGAIAPGWPVNGRAVCTAAFGQAFPTIASDGAHGAIVAWTDGRNQVNVRIFAQHVLGTGALDPVWPTDGRLISGVALIESRPLAVTDGAGGAVVTWQGFTNQPNVTNMFAQHIQATGIVDPAWPAGGQTLSFRQKLQSHAEIASDGAGGAIVAWDENSEDIFAQHVLANGSLDPVFPADGRALCNLPSQQGDVAIVTAGVGGAIVSWTDTRNPTTTGVDIFATQVLDAHPTGVPVPTPAAITFGPAFPNPARDSLTLRFVLSRETQFSLSIYDVAGRRVRELASGSRPAGEQTLAWDMRDEGGREVSSGIYFARLDADRHSLTQKLVKLK